MKRGLAAAAVLALLLPAGGSSARRSFQVLAHVRPARGYTADVSAFRGHAYLSSYHDPACSAIGVRVYDVRRLRKPRLVSTFARIEGSDTQKTFVRHVETRAFTGDVAVTAVQRCRGDSDAFQGFAVYDVTRPAKPRQLALVRTEPRGVHELWLANVGGRPYVYVTVPRAELRANQPDFRIFELSDPRAPREVGAFASIAELVGVQSRPGYLVHSVTTSPDGKRAYLSNWDLGTVILDIADPAKPRFLGRTEPPNGAAHSAAIDPARRLLVETHEQDGGLATVYSIVDETRPRRLADVREPLDLQPGGSMDVVGGLTLTRSVHDVRLSGKTAFFSWYGEGVVAADLSDAGHPRVVARFLPPPALDAGGAICSTPRCTAVWGVATLGNGVVLASDMNSGLWILKLR